MVKQSNSMCIAAAIILTIDVRLALVLFVLLMLGASGAIVVGWLSLLPSEREPFATPGEARVKRPRDLIAIFLLANLSLAVLLRLPGFNGTPLSFYLASIIPPDWANPALVIWFIWLALISGLAAGYAAVRANPTRVPLIVGGVLTLMFWLLGPWLLAAIAGAQRSLEQ
jgi:hypothetical protein